MSAKKPPPPDVDVVVGPPIAPAGVTVSVRVALPQAGEAMRQLVALVRATEPTLKLTPKERPVVEHVPGGSPVNADDDGWEARRVGFSRGGAR